MLTVMSVNCCCFIVFWWCWAPGYSSLLPNYTHTSDDSVSLQQRFRESQVVLRSQFISWCGDCQFVGSPDILICCKKLMAFLHRSKLLYLKMLCLKIIAHLNIFHLGFSDTEHLNAYISLLFGNMKCLLVFDTTDPLFHTCQINNSLSLLDSMCLFVAHWFVEWPRGHFCSLFYCHDICLHWSTLYHMHSIIHISQD